MLEGMMPKIRWHIGVSEKGSKDVIYGSDPILRSTLPFLGDVYGQENLNWIPFCEQKL